ncbi:MAG: glycoside hydrolase family 3 [Acidobacteria bacterium]|nr:glycoside hydrolase family 3 [Acidobacteriota bacterium]
MRLLVTIAFGLILGSSLLSCLGTPEEEDRLDLWIGQMLMVGFRGTDLKQGDSFLQAVRDLHLGGVVLFDRDVPTQSPVRNIVSQQQIQKLTAQLQAVAEVPLLIAIDQEGGQIARLKARHGFSATPSQAELGRWDDQERTRSSAREVGKLLASLGINLNFAPVLDLAVNPDNPIIAALERSYGTDPDRVERHARWTIEEFHRAGVLSAVKHFPGHGASKQDSHLGLPDVTHLWSETELEPFRSLLSEQLPDLVMMAHLYNAQWDETYPATLSSAVITGMLRQQLGFEGVVVSDDMKMGAIAQNYSLEESIELAVKAGVDILLFGNNSSSFDPQIAQKAVTIIRKLVESGTLSRDRVQQSYQRISDLKKKLNKIDVNN